MTAGAGRRLLAVAIASAALLALARDAVLSLGPLGPSLRAARRFRAASAEERLANAPFLRGDPGFARKLLAADRELPPRSAVVLGVPASLSREAAEERRRAAAYVLSPRLVSLERHAGEELLVFVRAPEALP